MRRGTRVTLGGEVANYYRGKTGVILDVHKEITSYGWTNFTNNFDYIARVKLDDGSIVTVHLEDLI